jgi:UDP-N-acetylmuramoylalanine--D-glutamate ligase
MDLKSKRVLVAGGLGKSGRAAAKLLCDLGAHVIFTDSDAEAELPVEIMQEAAHGRLTDVRPREDQALLDELQPDMIVLAPGVPLKNQIFLSAHTKRIAVYGENDLAAGLIQEQWTKKPHVVAITGTDGKSTTTALVAHLFAACQTNNLAMPCGNFGTPLSSLVLLPEAKRPDVLAVECSSFQLEPAYFMHAHCAMILNLSQDHLDRYAALSEYLLAKLNILRNQTEEDSFLAPSALLSEAKGPARMQSLESLRYVREEGIFFPASGERIAELSDFRLPGMHNRANLNCALFALEDYAGRRGITVNRDHLRELIRGFKGLPHRMEIAGEKDGILFVNDSKATTVQAVISGLTAFAGKKVALLAGGYDKGLVYTELSGRADVLLPFGQAGPKIAADTGTKEHFDTLEHALQKAVEVMSARGGGVVYLGPACASYDAYNSYEERGRHFCDLVAKIIRGTE